MSQDKPISVSISARGIMPAALAHDASAFFNEYENLTVTAVPSGFTLRAARSAEAENAIMAFQATIENTLEFTDPRIELHDEIQILEPIMAFHISFPAEFLNSVRYELWNRRTKIRGVDEVVGADATIWGLISLPAFTGCQQELNVRMRWKNEVKLEFHSFEPAPPVPGPDDPDPYVPAAAALRA